MRSRSKEMSSRSQISNSSTLSTISTRRFVVRGGAVSRHSTTRLQNYKAGEWYRLTLELVFQRRYGFAILQIYANLYLNVALSWLSFCISLKALPARVILTVNILMSMSLQARTLSQG